MRRKTILSRVLATVVAGALFAATAFGAEIKVMTSGGFTAAYNELVPEFERATMNDDE